MASPDALALADIEMETFLVTLELLTLIQDALDEYNESMTLTKLIEIAEQLIKFEVINSVLEATASDLEEVFENIGNANQFQCAVIKENEEQLAESQRRRSDAKDELKAAAHHLRLARQAKEEAEENLKTAKSDLEDVRASEETADTVSNVGLGVAIGGAVAGVAGVIGALMVLASPIGPAVMVIGLGVETIGAGVAIGGIIKSNGDLNRIPQLKAEETSASSEYSSRKAIEELYSSEVERCKQEKKSIQMILLELKSTLETARATLKRFAKFRSHIVAMLHFMNRLSNSVEKMQDQLRRHNKYPNMTQMKKKTEEAYEEFKRGWESGRKENIFKCLMMRVSDFEMDHVLDAICDSE